MTLGGIYFAACATLCLIGALWTVLARNPIRGAIGLLATIFGVAGLFLSLDAQFLAAIQLIVYAGAVVVLFVFVMLLLGADATDSAVVARSWLARAVAVVLALLSMGAFTVALMPTSLQKALVFPTRPPDYGSVSRFGDLLFSEWLVPFEICTVLLIVAVVGAVSVARVRRPGRQAEPLAHATLRLFGGPVHPRDAETPLVRPSAKPAGTEEERP
jgi:NADH-quinone oxidoreductase subunit J